jgi:hypothetical protein
MNGIKAWYIWGDFGGGNIGYYLKTVKGDAVFVERWQDAKHFTNHSAAHKIDLKIYTQPGLKNTGIFPIRSGDY